MVIDDGEEFSDLRTVVVDNDPLFEPGFIVDTQEGSTLVFLGVRLLLFVFVFLGISLLSPDVIKSDIVEKVIAVKNGTAFLVHEVDNIRPWNRVLRIELPDKVGTGPVNVTCESKDKVWSEIKELKLVGRNKPWIEVFESSILSFEKLTLQLQFEAGPLESIPLSIKTEWSPAIATVLDVFWRLIFAATSFWVSWHFNSDILKGKTTIEIERIITMLVSVATGLWNDSIFFMNYFSPTAFYIIYDNIARDVWYGVIMFTMIALMNITAVPEGGSNKSAILPPSIFSAFFILYRVYVNVTHLVSFDRRPASFTDPGSITLLFLFCVYFVVAWITSHSRRRDCYVMRHKVYTYAFTSTIVCWLLLFVATTRFPAITTTSVIGIMPYVFVNTFYLVIQLFHDNESKATSLYQMPGEGDDQENPFDLLDDEEQDNAGNDIQVGALNLI